VRKIDSVEDDMRGQVTYEITEGKWVTLDARVVRKYGLEEVMKYHGVEMPKDRLPVFQSGRKIGTVPAFFEPLAIKSRSFLYDVRPGDFKRTNEGWEALRSLGPGDLDAVPDFTREGEEAWQAHGRMVEEAIDVLSAMEETAK
jgi:hypothetical protein